ncbi:MAG TPA: ATP-binding cassette domain-containing protein, partial [Acidimicrobiia bacterium]|nr:ATP-binding cassette domain-containing protein [Acidimicrobiia bacterium]
RLVRQYSGGMVRRLEVGQAILNRPRLLILDEPTIGLDPIARGDLWDRVLSLRQESGTTVLLTTHYMEEADQLCDRLAIVDHGHLLALDTPAALKRSIDADTLITITADGDLDGLARLLEQSVGGVTGARVVDGSVRLSERGSRSALRDVIATAERGGFTINDVSVSEPTLETVFIQLTGKDLRD